jgi:hypothetical protein
VPRIHRGLGELCRVHLTQALVPLRRLLPPLVAALELQQRAVQLGVGVRVHVLLLALARVDQLDPVQRGHGGEYPARLNHRPHVAVEEREQQGPDVRAVHVGVGHEDDPLVPGRVQVERGARARAEDLDDRGALGILEHVGQRRLLHVEDLAPDRQQRLKLGVPGQLRRAER